MLEHSLCAPKRVDAVALELAPHKNGVLGVEDEAGGNHDVDEIPVAGVGEDLAHSHGKGGAYQPCDGCVEGLSLDGMTDLQPGWLEVPQLPDAYFVASRNACMRSSTSAHSAAQAASSVSAFSGREDRSFLYLILCSRLAHTSIARVRS